MAGGKVTPIAELRAVIQDCHDRCLYASAKIASDLLSGMHCSQEVSEVLRKDPVEESLLSEYDALAKAKSHFQLKEFLQARRVLSGATSRKATFMRVYAEYMNLEREKEEADDESLKKYSIELHSLADELAACSSEPDAYELWLLGVLYLRLGLREQAGAALLRAVWANPAFVSPWLELAIVFPTAAEARAKDMPHHWMQDVYRAHIAAVFHEHETASALYSGLRKWIPNSEYLLRQAALCLYHTRDFDAAQELFEDLRRRNPYCVDGMDVYSNILFVRGLKTELSHLAHSLVKVDKYRPETCCVIGNYYSIKSQHQQAVVYFKRALKLNPRYHEAWTLAGHEYLELKNSPGAIEAYRKAIEIDARDHRAWYGMGQAYELLHMYNYAVHYYSKACALRPHDGRMWAALGNTYKCITQPHDAIQCYKRADLNDLGEAGILHELAALYVSVRDPNAAAQYYARYIAKCAQNGEEDANSIGACLFLARYYKDRKQLEDAEKLATRVLRYVGRDKEEAKQLLQEIRALGSARRN